MKWLSSLLASALVPVAAAAPAVTFNKDVAPLVYAHCAPCHHAGGVGPFPLISYSDAARHASQIVAVTKSRYMPPWPPEHRYGSFVGDRSLTNEQIKVFADWLAAGKLQGNPADLPAPPRFTSEWQMGQPDLVLRMPVPFRMPATGSDLFRNFIVPTGLKETRYVRGFELRLTNTRVVHHANVVLDRTQSLRPRDGSDGQPGFAGMDVITEAAPGIFDPDSHFLFWKPASVLRLEPEDLSWRLDPGTDLVLNLHLQPTGREEVVQAEIGLYFSAHPPTRFPMLLQLEHDGALHIPAGDRSFVVSDSLTLPVDVDLLAIYPHAHYLGKTIEAWAALPDGTRRPLIRIPNWDINWQAEYEYRQPVRLPRGTRVAMRISYDNSAANPRNPNHPPKLVESGDRSQDEMGHVWLQVLPVAPAAANGKDEPAFFSEAKIQRDSRIQLQEAAMRRRLEKYPADFLAHYNLAALEQTGGHLAEAHDGYVQALRIQPASSAARNGLASVLMLQDKLPQAITQLREVLEKDPGYLNARYNLARSLAAQGELDDAIIEYRTFLQARPEDPQAEAALGALFYKKQQIPQAVECFQKAAGEAPGDADIQANFGTLLAITGDLRGAADAFGRALAVDPNHAAARANLAKVQEQLRSRN